MKSAYLQERLFTPTGELVAVAVSKIPRQIAMTRIAVAVALAVAVGCYSKPQKPQVEPLTFRQVQNPAHEMCRDDTESPTEWFNVPIAVFTAATVQLNGRPSSAEALNRWGDDYYRTKFEKALWVKISADGNKTAERALAPLIRTYPDLQLRRVDFEFQCPKISNRR